MLWDDFLNSIHRDWRGDGTAEDRLDDPAWFREWLHNQRLTPDNPLTERELASLKRLRALIHRMAEAFFVGGSPADEDLESLNKTMAQGAVVRKVIREEASYSLSLASTASRWPNIEAEIAASFGKLMAEGELSRIRICDNPSCLWVYYDDTKNRSKRYCDDKMCGNLMKVRRFRARRKAESGQPSSEF
ncbi:hypothetical protein D7Z26_00390 [Cohnella endophytica]|uniref:Zinc finger CGNR domain-containing protein n=1 Tax=Cohnella endophytica TaxID=2419778 RepID=A0A494YBI1_9BACL|nr:CGNR zinc finger domain-containing protein [Cohnella endophytica]RKP58006.1 hypothetical protein D7Z26_00390 [Cohnella endophytica]